MTDKQYINTHIFFGGGGKTTIKQRIDYIDLAKGICILLVVHGHACQTFGLEDNIAVNVLGSFRMPLYFILSGLFFKRYAGFLDFCIRKMNKLIIPFAFFYLIFSFILPCVYDAIDSVFSYENCIHYAVGWISGSFFNQATWFLMALFFTNIIFYCITGLSNSNNQIKIWRVVLLSFIVGSIGVILGNEHINIPFFIDTSMTAIPFFCTGYVLRKYTNILYPNRLDRYSSVVIMVLCLIFLIPYNYGSSIGALISNRININPILFYGCGIGGTLVVLLFSKAAFGLRLFVPIQYIGRYSIIILLVHQVLCKTITRYFLSFFPNDSIGVALTFIIVILLSSACIPIFKRCIPKFTAQEDLFKLH